jgi:hypothetical protein
MSDESSARFEAWLRSLVTLTPDEREMLTDPLQPSALVATLLLVDQMRLLRQDLARLHQDLVRTAGHWPEPPPDPPPDRA